MGSFETAPQREENTHNPDWRSYEKVRTEQIQRINNPETATTTLGNIALVYIFGGSIGAIGHMETVVLEGIVATTEIAAKAKFE